MTAGSGRQHRKDLQDLLRLPRGPFWSYLQKQSRPRIPRPRAEAARPVRHPQLAAFTPQRLWRWFSEYVRFRIGAKHPFLVYGGDDRGVYRMAEAGGEVRIALAGDWGTGTDEAASVATQIEAWAPHYAIHLGDVYYVGDRAEVEENFLGQANSANHYLPCQWPSGSEGTFALNGNHEMMARGFGYFDLMLPRLGPRGSACGQGASYFCLENDHWRIIALDTGYNSVGVPFLEYLMPPNCALRPELIEWLRTVVRPRADDLRGIVILSHHQYFSAFDRCYGEPGRQLAAFFTRPVLWLWGHEHRLAIYREGRVGHGVRAFGRCIGHGGMPVDLPGAAVRGDYELEFVDRRVYPNDEGLVVGYNGFATMTLRGSQLRLDYVDLDGALLFCEVWEAGRGGLVRLSGRDAERPESGSV